MANLVTFAKKLWKDATSGGTPITAAELNRMEGGINDCATQINRLGDSVSPFTTSGISYISSNVKDGIVFYIRLKATDEKEYGISFLRGGIRLYNVTDSVAVWEISS